MAKETVLYLPATATALWLLIAIYKTPAIKGQETSESVPPNFRTQFTFNKEPKLKLENGQEITGENTISEFLGETFDKSIHWTPELRAECLQWLSRSSKFTSSPEEVYVRSPKLERVSDERLLIVGWRLDGCLFIPRNHRGSTTFCMQGFILWWYLFHACL
jgi:hypothetical protein